MNYQDTWVNGQMIEKGERECADRYEIVRNFCSQYRRPFTVLDIGANLCYMGIRLAEDFPECTVVAVECCEWSATLSLLRANDARRVVLLTKTVSLDDLRELAKCEHFDLVLSLSVVHRFDGPFEERVRVFQALGDHLILEVPNEPCTGGNVDPGYRLPPSTKIIGHGASHLVEGGKREIALLSSPKITIEKAYLGCQRVDLFMSVYSDFDFKRVRFHNKTEPERDWLRGVNLKTYLDWSGVWPERAFIASLLSAQREDVLAQGHNDIQAHNVILQGDAAILIDARDPNMTVDFPDEEYFGRLLEALR